MADQPRCSQCGGFSVADSPCPNCGHEEEARTSYPQLRSLLAQPWAITEEALLSIRELVALRVRGVELTDDEKRKRIGATSYAARRQPGAPYGAANTAGNGSVVAILPLYGVIVPKASLFSDVSGASSVEGFKRMYREALNDRDVSAIVIDVDSPGGQTDLITELCAEIRDGRGEKPVVAVANTLMCSAAYWIASQADEIVGSPSSKVGSVGVFCVHDDISAMQEKAGVKTTLISAGKYKTEGNPFEPLSEHAIETIQARVDAAYGDFVADVAAGRGVDETTVRNGYGEGDVLDARAALTAGLIDRLDTIEATVMRVAGDAARPNATTAFTSGGGTYANGYLPPGYGAIATGSAQISGMPGVVPGVAALGGGRFSEDAETARAAVAQLGARTRSLAEFKRGQLTVTKREQLQAVVAACDDIAELLATTDPDQRQTDNGALTLEDEWALAEHGLAANQEGS